MRTDNIYTQSSLEPVRESKTHALSFPRKRESRSFLQVILPDSLQLNSSRRDSLLLTAGGNKNNVMLHGKYVNRQQEGYKNELKNKIKNKLISK